jgi:hypothetical protein
MMIEKVQDDGKKEERKRRKQNCQKNLEPYTRVFFLGPAKSHRPRTAELVGV